jgi:PAS domain S-box-containing protein
MAALERLWEPKNRTVVSLASTAMISAIGLIDWWIKPYVSLGFLYLFPIMLVAAFFPRWAVALLGVISASLAEIFSPLEVSYVRFSFEALALVGCGLFVGELIRSRRMNIEAQDKLRTLVETSPAAIITVDDRGFVELANRAALELMAPRRGDLIGTPIGAVLPDLHHAVRWENAPQFRASMQCRGHRGNGEAFMADVWFSTYREGGVPKLAAIIGDVTEDHPVSAVPAQVGDAGRMSLTSREVDVLKLVVQGLSNKRIASALEVSESAVKSNLQQLFAKSGVRTRGQLVRVALEDYRNLL